ncbi:type IV secretion system protein [Kineosporia sp. J2-2]|uniref:Type IV secretion system protein n=1 Tax=Kineosporia corallincola TaxID=2835133 RepID=A0ABS5TTN7_9ACTN|nr:conjugal transfer protein TrbL family protein [Kineosporia corallincola]MBT0774182.1 type IV secretion system protein [Kineosporia corallincola]
MDDWLIEQVFNHVADMVLEPLPQLLILVRDLVLRVPEVASQQPVVRLAGRSLAVVQVGYVVIVAVAGLVAMTHGGLQSQYSAKDLLQRAVLGFMASHFAVWVVSTVTTAANALVGALAGSREQSLEQLNASKGMSRQIAKAPESLLVLLALQVLIVVLLIVLLVSWVLRFVRLALLAALGPLALACHGLPWLQPVAVAWWSSLAGVVLTVLVQTVALQFGLDLLLEPGANLSGVGTFDHSDALTNMLLIVCLLLVVVRTPRMVSQFLPTTSRRGGTGSTVLRYVVLNRLLHRGVQASGGAHPAGWLTTRLTRRFAMRQAHRDLQRAGFVDPSGPTWSEVGQRLAAGGRSVRSSAPSSWRHSLASSRFDGGRWEGLRKSWAERRAVLAGRSVGEPGQLPARVAGGTRTRQRAAAAQAIRLRREQTEQLPGTRAHGLRGDPLRGSSGRIAGHPRPANDAAGTQGRGGRRVPSTTAGRSAQGGAGGQAPVTRPVRARPSHARRQPVRTSQQPPIAPAWEPVPGRSRLRPARAPRPRTRNLRRGPGSSDEDT